MNQSSPRWDCELYRNKYHRNEICFMPQKYAGILDAEMISGTVEYDLYQKQEMVRKFELK